MEIILSHDQFYTEYNTRLAAAYPSIAEREDPWKNRTVISPFQVSITPDVIDSISEAVDNIYRLSRHAEYKEALLAESVDKEILCSRSPNLSVLMSYDFHLDEDTPKLLEINTNASGFLLSDMLYDRPQGNPYPDAMASLKDSFMEEFKRLGLNRSPRIAIIDETPHTQKMYPEFLFYQSLFSAWGYKAGIHDYRDLTYRDGALFAQNEKVDFIYNRYCDFTFSNPSSKALRRAYLDGACGFSPNPKEYILLADKKNMALMNREGWMESIAAPDISLNAIRKVLIPSWQTHDFESPREIWEKRKQLFFKPMQSYGGKSAYRGKSITRKTFQDVVSRDCLIQQYVPTPKITFKDDETSASWKYDIRAYAYGGNVQMLVARIYQGQISNFNQPNGGYCPVYNLAPRNRLDQNPRPIPGP